MSEQELTGGVYVFNHTAVNDVVAALIRMHPAELRMVAAKLAAHDGAQANMLIDLLIHAYEQQASVASQEAQT